MTEQQIVNSVKNSLQSTFRPMTEQRIINYMKNTMSNIVNESPTMLIAGAAKWFRDIYKGAITDLSSIDSVNQFIEHHSNKKYKYPLVININFSSAQAENGLLKFIEEAKTSIIVISEYDKCSSILMSRFKAVYKFPMRKPSNKFLSIKQAQQELEQPSALDFDSRVATLSPKLYQLNSITPNKRIQELLGDYYDRFNK